MSRKMNKQRNVFQMKEQDKPSEKDLGEMRIILHLIEFKIITIKMLIKVKRAMQ